MKSQNIRIPVMLALAASVVVSASTASAAGLLGQRYFGGTIDYVIWDDDAGLDNGLGFTLGYNQPLASNFDLSLGFSWLNSDIEGSSTDITAYEATFGAAWFTPVSSNAKFFAGADIGWFDADFIDDDTFFVVRTGVEFMVNQSFSATPFVSYADTFNDDGDGTFNFGVIGEFDLGNNWSVLATASVNDDSDVQISGGVVLRF